MSNVKQIIVMRKFFEDKDGKKFQVRRGKQIAQACHASMKIFFDRLVQTEIWEDDGEYDGYMFKVTDKEREWIEGSFTKICLYCDDLEQLMDISKKADEAGLVNSLIIDNGLTEFGGVPTATCLAIGPADGDKIDKITGELKLL